MFKKNKYKKMGKYSVFGEVKELLQKHSITLYAAIFIYCIAFLSPILTAAYAEELDLKVGGFIKINAAVTSDGINGFDDASGFYNADLLFADENEGARFGFDARETRFHFTLKKQDTPIGPIKTYIEANFAGEGSTNGNAVETYGNHQYSFLLRHAYVETDHFLIGQTFSLFSDLNVVMNVLDFGGNAGMVFSRNPQIRYTHKLDNLTFRVSLENPSTTLGYNEISDDQRYPDLIARVDYDPNWGHFSIATVMRELRVENDNFEANKFTGGVSVTASKEIVPGIVTILAQYFHGTVGQYGMVAGFADGLRTVNERGEQHIDPVVLRGGNVGTTIKWSDKFQSIVLGSWAESIDKNNNLQTFGTGHAIENVWSLTANLYYNITEDLLIGLEYKKIVGNLSDQTHPNVDRGQASIIYSF